MFRDVTSLFSDPNGFDLTLTGILSSIENIKIDKVLGIEARGFILGGALANRLHCGFVPIRKSGKLPGAVISQDYQLEYGSDTLEIHVDSIEPGEKVLLVDDLLATGGTAEAGIKLIEKLGGNIVSCNFIVNLPKLGGDKKLADLGISTHFLCSFEGI
jgi:adenine phosphoribosyltransferase